MKEVVSNSIPTIFIERLLSAKVLWNQGPECYQEHFTVESDSSFDELNIYK